MAKLIGKGTKLYVENKNTPDQWDAICFVELTQPEPEWGEVEVTDSCHTGKTRHFDTTMLDNGTCEFTGNYDNDTGSKAIATDLNASFKLGEKRNFRIDHDQLSPGERKEFTGHLSKFVTPKFDGNEEKLKIMGSIRISGDIVESDIA